MQEIDVLALEAEHFASTELAPRRQKHGQSVPLGDGLDGSCDLGHAGGGPFRRADLAGTLHLARTGADQAVRDRCVEDRSEQPVGVIGGDRAAERGAPCTSPAPLTG